MKLNIVWVYASEWKETTFGTTKKYAKYTVEIMKEGELKLLPTRSYPNRVEWVAEALKEWIREQLEVEENLTVGVKFEPPFDIIVNAGRRIIDGKIIEVLGLETGFKHRPLKKGEIKQFLTIFNSK